MTSQLELERILDDYLGDGTDELADHVLAAAFLTIDHTRQRRALRVPWRNNSMPTPLRLLVAATLLATALGGAYVLGGLNPNLQVQPPPSPTQTAPSSDPVAIGATPGGTWVADRPAAFDAEAGQYELTLLDGADAVATAPGDRDILLGSVAFGSPTGEATLGPIGGCADAGLYRFSVSVDVRTLTVDAVGDSCVPRATVLAGTWTRTAIREQLKPNERYSAALEPALSFVVPPGFEKRDGTTPVATSDLSDAVNDLLLDAEDFFAYVGTGPTVLRDRCDMEAGTRPMPTTLDEFVAWNRATTGASVSEPVRATVDGHDAIRVDVVPGDGCPNGQVQANCGCLTATALVIGMADRTWAVDVDGTVVLIQFHDDNPPWLELTPERLEIAQTLVDSIEFD